MRGMIRRFAENFKRHSCQTNIVDKVVDVFQNAECTRPRDDAKGLILRMKNPDSEAEHLSISPTARPD